MRREGRLLKPREGNEAERKSADGVGNLGNKNGLFLILRIIRICSMPNG
jgi:hypothetical protein